LLLPLRSMLTVAHKPLPLRMVDSSYAQYVVTNGVTATQLVFNFRGAINEQ
jgi:hypothetical protein